jgi:iron-sulfur cluster repair protein YtfE (RIC family)
LNLSELDEHIIPVLMEKAKSPRTAGLIRSWNYYKNAIFEHAEKTRKCEGPLLAQQQRSSRKAKEKIAAREEERKGFEQALADLKKGFSKREATR